MRSSNKDRTKPDEKEMMVKASEFCYWLQGYFKIRKAGGGGNGALDTNQVEMIKRHLALVFVHDIDPSQGPPEVQELLQAIHDGQKAEGGGTASSLDPDVVYRC